MTGPHLPESLDSVGLGWSPRISTCKKFPGDAEAAGRGATLCTWIVYSFYTLNHLITPSRSFSFESLYWTYNLQDKVIKCLLGTCRSCHGLVLFNFLNLTSFCMLHIPHAHPPKLFFFLIPNVPQAFSGFCLHCHSFSLGWLHPYTLLPPTFDKLLVFQD